MVNEKFDIFVYEKQAKILKTLRFIIFFVSLFVLASLVIYYGYEHTPERKKLLVNASKLFYIFFILNYIMRLIFTLDRRDFIRHNWVEGLLLLFVVYDAVNTYLFDYPLLYNILLKLNIAHTHIITLFIQLYLLLLVTIEFIKYVQTIDRIKVRPPILFIGSFIALILIGSGLLSLPAMNVTGESMPFIDAFFTATSASCVTGLIVEDTATFFTLKGQIIILVLFQLGGIGIISFATFFATFIKKGIGIQQQNALKEMFDSDSLSGAYALLRQIFLTTFFIELIAIVFIFSLWGDTEFHSFDQKLFYSVFHGVSAFCNAGFSLFSDGLFEEGIRHLYLMHIVIAVVIFFGGLGFPAIRDIFSRAKLRQRMDQPWKRWKLSTQIAVYASFTLIAIGTLMFYILENNNTLAGTKGVEGVIISFFQSVTTRTAGFNTVDIGALRTPTLVIFMFLMFVGASSGSTGGGIKTSTFVVIFKAIIGIIRGQKTFSLGRRTISNEILFKAFSIFVFSASFIFVCITLLSIFEPYIPIQKLAFEEISAFGTVGLSTGITSILSSGSKIVIIISMFVGRVGLLTLAFALSSRRNTARYNYPSTHIMIG